MVERPIDARERDVIARIERARARPRAFRDPLITTAHGAGGKATRHLVESLLVPTLAGGTLAALDDCGRVRIGEVALAMTTDSFVVRPLRFPGGSIGELAVNGTVNDLAMAGAAPLAMTLSLVLEEGLDSEVLRAEIAAVAAAARAAGVEIVSGDTKVVGRGQADGMYLCTTGIGLIDPRAALDPGGARAGDRILVSGSIAEHGIAVMLARGEFELGAAVESDTCSLWPAVAALLDACPQGLRTLRDPTRGGVASVLNELAAASQTAMVAHEDLIPVARAVGGACELLGIDPMYVACEGRLVAIVAPDAAAAALAALRGVPGCEGSCEIGVVEPEPRAMALVETSFGSRRVMDMLVGDPLPRIC
jgi:hydrogenase expression/formation protein HypE